ncbi:hypothetical protein BC939DRAFT_298603 [Gamsiella multidivaricata]|uniref:uncharacterized protein n=1 Tax=Gamsiella multidivaricata TaxID=101098 RepID=UPI0022207413|nr:uncharacterized protein BC939DRAFT_298603 [Gamsiella multidivaricata]KAI7818234.1 hypothetical protein BC939DRAFT_298603 [Gamsiella multidivaricata]
MGRDFGFHFADFFTGALLKVCARTNKVMVSRAVKALNSIINAGCLTTLPRACQAFITNNKALRIACIGLIATCIAQFPSQDLEPFVAAFEPVLKEGVSDAAPEVRDTSRKSFKVYAEKFPDRAQILTTTLPGNVLKYLLPDSRSSVSQARTITASTARSASSMGRFGDTGELPRHQSSRELTTGLSRTGPSRTGPMRARTMAMTEHAPSASFKMPSTSAPHTSQSTQPYTYHITQHQHHHQQQPPSQQLQSSMSQQHHTLTRNHGPASRTGSLADTSDSAGHGTLRLASQRSRPLSSSALTPSSMLQRTPSINLATNGGPQRVVPASYNADAAKPTRPTSVSRFSKTEPASKANRISTISSHSTHSTSLERDPNQMSASERAKAYSASLKNEMASRRASDLHMRTGLGTRRATSDHVGYSGYASMSSTSISASSNASTAPTSAAASTTSASPASSSSTSPTAMHSPNHDHLFSTFRAPASSQTASSPSESCTSPDARRWTPPRSQPSDDAINNAVESDPLSPTVMAQVSLEADRSISDRSISDQNHHQEHQQQHQNDVSVVEALSRANTGQTPLSPHSPLHPHTALPYPPLTQSGEHEQANSPNSLYAPPSPLQENHEADVRDFDFAEAYSDADTDHNMSVPDHESLFGNTESYLQIEKEILELQQSLKGRVPARSNEGQDRSDFMDEDAQVIEQEQIAVKVYAEEYEATLAAASCSSTSLPSSHEEE